MFKATMYEGVAPCVNVTSYAVIPPEPGADSELISQRSLKNKNFYLNTIPNSIRKDKFVF
jgi:hypothetical protein